MSAEINWDMARWRKSVQKPLNIKQSEFNDSLVMRVSRSQRRFIRWPELSLVVAIVVVIVAMSLNSGSCLILFGRTGGKEAVMPGWVWFDVGVLIALAGLLCWV